MKHKRIEIKDFYHIYYNVKSFRKTYFEVVHPLQEVVLDPKDKNVIILLPNLNKSMGWPKKNRRMGEEEEDGHNNVRKKGSHTKV